jgi:predicted ATPase
LSAEKDYRYSEEDEDSLVDWPTYLSPINEKNEDIMEEAFLDLSGGVRE